MGCVNDGTRKFKIMKKTYIIFFACFIAATSFGQSLGRTVFNSTGGYIGTPGGVQMLLSVGEPITGMAGGNGISLGQGFLGGSKSVSSPSGIAEIEADQNATVYPNPFTNHIKINSAEENIHVSIYNTMGQEVYSGSYTTAGIDLPQLTSGIYIVQAISNNKIISNTKLLKQ